ncbi:MAG: elongation factor P hydroxylase [Gammaproteobacteria bacterium]|nr:elongation factor P hydroxylase [Gammaproteobacteria bacterium]
MQHSYQNLIDIFNQQFLTSHQTELVKGGDEPIYLPADQQNRYHRIIFARGFFASALHEISHWLVAGESRRLLEDFGYWYCPDGRDQQTQIKFEQVEIKPQAIEWALATACGFRFNVSSDNLNGWQSNRVAFQHQVHQQVKQLIEQGFNARTQQLLLALNQFYQTPAIAISQFHYCEIKENQ